MKDQLITHIRQSPLLGNEQEELIEILTNTLSDEQTTQFVELIQEKEWLVPYLWVNLSAKRYASAKQDPDAFNRILDNELAVLKNIDTDAVA